MAGRGYRLVRATARLDPAEIRRHFRPRRLRGEIVHYDTPSGGAVFSVGSITYPASILVDDVVSRITANVLRRFLA